MLLYSIKILNKYNFDVLIVIADVTSKNNSIFEGLATLCIDLHISLSLVQEYSILDFNYHCVFLYLCSKNLYFIISDIPNLVKKAH